MLSEMRDNCSVLQLLMQTDSFASWNIYILFSIILILEGKLRHSDQKKIREKVTFFDHQVSPTNISDGINTASLAPPGNTYECYGAPFSEKAMAPHSSTLAWRSPWTEEPGGLPSVGSHRVGHD